MVPIRRVARVVPGAGEVVAARCTGQSPASPAGCSDGTDGRWRIARKVAPERVISTVDPETRHAHKTRARHQDGYKAHVKVEPDTGLITGCALTPAAGPEHSDAAVGIALLAGEPDPVEVLGDAAYGTGELLAAVADGGHTAIIKPWPLRPAVDGGFTLDDFLIDETADTATCPNGLTARITRTRTAVFGARCRACPLRARCTTSRPGGRCACIRTKRCNARTGLAPEIPSSRPSTASTGLWSNARSPGWSPAATGGCGSSEPGSMICGCTTGSRR